MNDGTTGNERRTIPLEQPLFDRVDPEFFDRLVDHFYDGVVADPVLAPLYPPDDIAGARERLRLFLVQFWGGPQTYSELRGHPRLRMRHAPYVIGEAERACGALQKAHAEVCPYSHATRNNVDVQFTVKGA